MLCYLTPPKFCSMRISQDIRDEFGSAAAQAEIARAEMRAKSREFATSGGRVHSPDPAMPGADGR